MKLQLATFEVAFEKLLFYSALYTIGDIDVNIFKNLYASKFRNYTEMNNDIHVHQISKQIYIKWTNLWRYLRLKTN